MRRGLLPAMVLLLLAWGAVGCGQGGQTEGELSRGPSEGPPIHAVATLPPLAWFVERLAGDRAEVEVLIPPGADPHTFEPSPRQVYALTAARLVVQVGHREIPFEERVVDQVRRQNPGARIVALADPRRAAGENPHLWVDPEAVRPLASAITQALAQIDPAGGAHYAARLEDLEHELDTLDAELHSILAGAQAKTFVVHHPTWGAFAERYGLEQLALEHEGKEPGPRRLSGLIAEARAKGVEVVLVQRGFSDKAARTTAREIGARIAEVDPLARDWPESLRQAARAIAGQAADPRSFSPAEPRE